MVVVSLGGFFEGRGVGAGAGSGRKGRGKKCGPRRGRGGCHPSNRRRPFGAGHVQSLGQCREIQRARSEKRGTAIEKHNMGFFI